METASQRNIFLSAEESPRVADALAQVIQADLELADQLDFEGTNDPEEIRKYRVDASHLQMVLERINGQV